MSECPFKPCNANVILIIEQAVPGDDEGTIRRVPGHATGGHEDFGLCPASLMVVPLDEYSSVQLDEQAVALLRIIGDRKAAAEPWPERSMSNQPEHALTPHPDSRGDRWFGTHRPPLRALPADGSNTIQGSAVASIEEVKAIIARAGQLAAEAKDATFVAEGKVAEALQLVNVARDASTDTMGAPELLEAVRLLGEAGAMMQVAIEAGVTYRGTR